MEVANSQDAEKVAHADPAQVDLHLLPANNRILPKIQLEYFFSHVNCIVCFLLL